MDEDFEMQNGALNGSGENDNDNDNDNGEDTEAQENGWVMLQSNDGFSYILRRKVAETSGTVHNMLDPDGGYAEAQRKICWIDERGIVTEKLVEYMCFKGYYQSVGPKEDIPVQEMQERIPPEIVLEVLLAADYQEM